MSPRAAKAMARRQLNIPAAPRSARVSVNVPSNQANPMGLVVPI